MTSCARTRSDSGAQGRLTVKDAYALYNLAYKKSLPFARVMYIIFYRLIREVRADGEA